MKKRNVIKTEKSCRAYSQDELLSIYEFFSKPFTIEEYVTLCGKMGRSLSAVVRQARNGVASGHITREEFYRNCPGEFEGYIQDHYKKDPSEEQTTEAVLIYRSPPLWANQQEQDMKLAQAVRRAAEDFNKVVDECYKVGLIVGGVLVGRSDREDSALRIHTISRNY